MKLPIFGACLVLLTIVACGQKKTATCPDSLRESYNIATAPRDSVTEEQRKKAANEVKEKVGNSKCLAVRDGQKIKVSAARLAAEMKILKNADSTSTEDKAKTDKTIVIDDGAGKTAKATEKTDSAAAAGATDATAADTASASDATTGTDAAPATDAEKATSDAAADSATTDGTAAADDAAKTDGAAQAADAKPLDMPTTPADITPLKANLALSCEGKDENGVAFKFAKDLVDIKGDGTANAQIFNEKGYLTIKMTENSAFVLNLETQSIIIRSSSQKYDIAISCDNGSETTCRSSGVKGLKPEISESDLTFGLLAPSSGLMVRLKKLDGTLKISSLDRVTNTELSFSYSTQTNSIMLANKDQKSNKTFNCTIK
jgi:hypothetical protein